MYILQTELIHEYAPSSSKLAQHFLHSPSSLYQLRISSIGVCQLDICV
jgi:hypothetical protein